MVIEDDETPRQVAKLLKIPKKIISFWVLQHKKEHNIPIQTRKPHSQKQKDRAIKMIKEGRASKQIAKLLKIPEDTIYFWRRQHKRKRNIPIQTRRPYPQEQKEKAIKMVIEGGKTQRQVAKLFKVSESTISSWIHEYKRNHKEETSEPYEYKEDKRHNRDKEWILSRNLCW